MSISLYCTAECDCSDADWESMHFIVILLFSLHLFYRYALWNLAILATETNKCDLIDLTFTKVNRQLA